MNAFTGPDSKRFIDDLIMRIAGNQGKEAGRQLYDNTMAWSGILAETGLEGDRSYMRNLRAGISDFAAEIRIWAANQPLSEANTALSISDFAREVDGICRRHIKTIDDFALRPGVFLKRWSEAAPALMKTVSALDWTTDGWNAVIETWAARPLDDPGRTREILNDIAGGLPLLPAEALSEESIRKRDGFAETTRRRIVVA
ncbi:MAG: hypothetical protein ING19_21725, partial [Azospirillum sp.]|nr:hypothetical protein [Azospirillum sp.]